MSGQYVQESDQVPVLMTQPTKSHVQQPSQRIVPQRHWGAFWIPRKAFFICLLAFLSAMILVSILELIFVLLATAEYQRSSDHVHGGSTDNKWVFATYPSPENLQIGSASTALLLAGIYGAMTIYSFRKGPIKAVYWKRFGSVVALGLAVVLAVASAIYTLVMHARSDHLNYAQAVDSFNRYGWIEDKGVFDVDTWTCEVAALPIIDRSDGTNARICIYRTGVRSLCVTSSILSIAALVLVWRDWKREKWLLRTWKTRPTQDSDGDESDFW